MAKDSAGRARRMTGAERSYFEMTSEQYRKRYKLQPRRAIPPSVYMEHIDLLWDHILAIEREQRELEESSQADQWS